MCLLPARSMPGSEMLFVEKTRILGLNAVSTMVVTAGSIGLAKEELQVACVVDRTEELMTQLLAPRGQVLQCPGVGGEHFHDTADRNLADGLLGCQDRSGARGGAGVNDQIGLQLLELLDCNGHGDTSLKGRVIARRGVVWCIWSDAPRPRRLQTLRRVDRSMPSLHGTRRKVSSRCSIECTLCTLCMWS